MRLGKAAIAILIYGSLGSQDALGADIRLQFHAGNSVQVSEAKVLDVVLPLGSRGGGRFYYLADCTSGDEPVGFPVMSVRPPPATASAPDALRYAFQGNDDLKVSEERGLFRLTVGPPPIAILSARISRLRLSGYARTDPNLAIEALENADEVRSAADQLHVAEPATFIDHQVLTGKRRPRLPSELRNVTLEEALDQVARTFRGVVFYGACAQPALFDITFQPMP
jgi:hypothetical protein